MRDRKVHAYRACMLLHAAELLHACVTAALFAKTDTLLQLTCCCQYIVDACSADTANPRQCG